MIETILISIISSGIISTIISILFDWKSEVKKERTLKYYSLQFEKYNELWSELVELQIIANELWEKAQMQKMIKFKRQLDKTKNIIKKNSLIIEESDYKKLFNILNSFESYKVGKENLIQSRKLLQNNDDEIIQNNKKLKKEYDKLLEKINKNLRSQLKVI